MIYNEVYYFAEKHISSSGVVWFVSNVQWIVVSTTNGYHTHTQRAVVEVVYFSSLLHYVATVW